MTSEKGQGFHRVKQLEECFSQKRHSQCFSKSPRCYLQSCCQQVSSQRQADNEGTQSIQVYQGSTNKLQKAGWMKGTGIGIQDHPVLSAWLIKVAVYAVTFPQYADGAPEVSYITHLS
jgi:hypothetical protein